MPKKITTVAASLAVASLMSFAVQANDTAMNTQEWANEAGKAISSVMRYPAIALRQGRDGSASFVVTVNRDGDVVDYYANGGKNAPSFKSSSKRALKMVDFPALPSSLKGDQVSFTLNMEYKSSRQAYLDAKSKKQGTVSGTRIALLPSASLSTGR